MARPIPLKICAAVLGIVLVVVGLSLARKKPLWNDEIFSQVSSVEKLGYRQIVFAGLGEGNNCPLFYALQKGLCGLLRYRSPQQWREGASRWHFDRPVDRIVLRVNPVVFMSAAIVVVFYYFSRYYSWWAGLFSLFLFLTSTQLWRFWAEARPYALWVFLTAVQLLLFLSLVHRRGDRRVLWRWLILGHLALALTIVFGLAQIVVVSALLWFYTERRWTRYILLTALPSVITLIYYFRAPRFSFWLEFSLEQYIRAGMSRDQLYIMLLFVFGLVLFALQQKKLFPRLYADRGVQEGVPILLAVTGILLSVTAVFLLFKIQESPDRHGFAVTDRYFIHLVPVGVVATGVFVRTLLMAFRDKKAVQVILFSGMGYFILYQAQRSVREIVQYIRSLASI